MPENKSPVAEPWMRGTHTELDALRRAVVHALELAEEDGERWCASLSDAEMFARPAGLPSVAFHLRHIARSLDRLMTYAEGRGLDAKQLAALQTETDSGTATEVLAEFRKGMGDAKERAQSFEPSSYEQVRGIGRKRLPTTAGGLLIHCAEHTSRHVGQAVTTAKLVRWLVDQGSVTAQRKADVPPAAKDDTRRSAKDDTARYEGDRARES